MLLLNELGFLAPNHPRFIATIKAIESELKHGDFIFRYVEKDDFGEPENAFVVCTFWYIYALASVGRKQEARRLFEHMLAQRNQYGMLPEHIDPCHSQIMLRPIIGERDMRNFSEQADGGFVLAQTFQQIVRIGLGELAPLTAGLGGIVGSSFSPRVRMAR